MIPWKYDIHHGVLRIEGFPRPEIVIGNRARSLFGSGMELLDALGGGFALGASTEYENSSKGGHDYNRCHKR